MSLCPKCRREFAVEGGFCPYDGVALAASQPDLTERSSPPVLSADIEVVSFLDENAPDLLERLRKQHTVEYDHLVGTELDGRYAIEEKIGEGGMGVVFRGRHVVIEKPVAIKVLKKEVASDQNVVKRFVQEARAASRIGHPNIIDVTDFGATSDGMTYQVMEFIDGETLATTLKRERRLSVPRALEISAQIARALLAAHSKGIVHRDLKPENVFLVEREGRGDFVKIVDFGIAKVAPMPGRTNEPRITRVGTVFGTPEYMAPEQAAGREDVDHRVDIYALGTILYELLTGKVPHRGESAVRTLAMQMLDAVVPLRQQDPSLPVGDELETVILKALAKMPEDRYQSMSEFLDALGAATSQTELDLERLLRKERQATADALDEEVEPDPAGSASFTTEMETVVRGVETAERPAISELDVDRTVERPEAIEPTASDFVQTENWTQNPVDAEETRDLTPRPASSEPSHPSAATASALSPVGLRREGAMAHDPAFVTQKQLPIFDDPDDEAYPPEPRKSVAWIAVAVIGLGGAAAAGWYVTRGGADRAAVVDAADAAVALADAARPPNDAGSVADALAPAADAARNGAEGPVGVRGGSGAKRRLELTVETIPSGASLYIGDTYAGSDGLHVVRERGTRLEMICRKAGYGSGKVTLIFDGGSNKHVCRLKRHKKCLPGIKNPFDDCPDSD